MQLLAAKFAQIASAIDTTNAQIAALQVKLSELQEHQQQLLSVEQACQSALAQVGTALSMLNHVDPAEIPTFKAAIEAQFGTDAIAFLESATPTPAETVEPEPTAPTAPEPTPETEPVIDVKVTTDAPIETTSEVATTDIERLLNKMTIQDIRKLAAAKKVNGSGTRSAIAGRLKAIVTESDVWSATA
jgi:outer membrane biosynthesis protein TonB